MHLLPIVVSVPAVAGHLKRSWPSWHGVPAGVPVGVALGDMQCSVLAAEPTTTDAGKSADKIIMKLTWPFYDTHKLLK